MTAPAPPGPDLDHLFLVDGSGFVFRAFHALPPMTKSDGTPINAVYGFCNMLLKLLERQDAGHIAVIFDAGRATFRNDISADYKAHRPDPPSELVPQFPLIREATRAFNLPCVELPGFEADDLIATYAKQAEERGAQVTIVSSDKDLMQLVRERVRMFDPIKLKDIGPDEVRERFGVGPERVADVQALAGDPVDNVPGVPGIGVKTAAQLITEYGDLESLLQRAPEIKQPKRRETLVANTEQARISRQLVQLKDDVPVAEHLDAFAVRQADSAMLLDFLRLHEFRSIAQRVEARGTGTGIGLPRAHGAGAPVQSAQPSAAPVPGEVRYTLVTTPEALDAWAARAVLAGSVALDLRRSSGDPQRADLIGLALAVAPGKACYVPLGHVNASQGDLELGAAPSRIDQLDPATALAVLRPMLEDPSVLKVGHDVKEAMCLLGRPGLGGEGAPGIAVGPVDDTMLQSYVLEGSKREHGLKDLAKALLDHDIPVLTDVTGTGRARVDFAALPVDKALAFSAEQADMVLRLHRTLRPRLAAERVTSVYEEIERPLVQVLAAMERHGVLIDRGELASLSRDLGERLVGLEEEIYRHAGRSFNIGSPKQLGEVLFDELALAGGRKAKTGAYVTNADVLEELAAQGHDLPARVLDWRQLAKLKNTYADTLPEQINPLTGRVHTSFGMVGTSTGRLSSSDPNLQNIPIRTEEGRKIRRAFVAAPGTVLLSADYSQIELRLLAHVADIEVLKTAFRDGDDIHAMTASQVFGVPVEGMDPLVRRQAKAINFGIIYGISPFGLARQLGIAQGDARVYIQAYFERYPGIRDYMERAKSFARRHGHVTTLFGRRCWTPGIQDKNPARRSFMERAAINAPLQGAAADIIKRAMARIQAALEGRGLAAKMLLQVHDELLFEVPEAEAEATAAVVGEVMASAARLDVPLVVETGTGRNWAEAH